MADDLCVEAVLAQDTARLAALVAGDVASLDKIFHPDLHYVHTNGTAETKPAFLERLRLGSAYRSVVRENAEVFVHTDMAWVRGRVRMTVQFPGKEPFDMAAVYLAVWILRNGQWQLHSYASSPAAIQ